MEKRCSGRRGSNRPKTHVKCAINVPTVCIRLVKSASLLSHQGTMAEVKLESSKDYLNESMLLEMEDSVI